ncbi:uncharacterized protein CC84DRAFT_1176967 [Paraphaeosphaeria sporulosa]|uniref:Uncharacterized protein n=1 Tax=Paraphaeosphaeria sporulosa TaxID=1460663 RepID=A0A177CAM9_9PLEO|nr:uncharacterized protein CC84DRAFT_1176967 [Paraphaeosphaeria sporulosa]OAG04804.1 hypothetical protein CC84DRAFT_1176967 [Paraphaeosphaeria sporulosa]
MPVPSSGPHRRPYQMTPFQQRGALWSRIFGDHDEVLINRYGPPWIASFAHLYRRQHPLHAQIAFVLTPFARPFPQQYIVNPTLARHGKTRSGSVAAAYANNPSNLANCGIPTCVCIFATYPENTSVAAQLSTAAPAAKLLWTYRRDTLLHVLDCHYTAPLKGNGNGTRPLPS